MEQYFRIKQGANFKRVINVVENGSAKNLNGYLARMQIRDGRSSAANLLSDVTAYITINDPNNGQLTLNIPSTVTETYSWSHGVYDIEVYNGTTDVLSVLEGYVSVMKEVTS